MSEKAITSLEKVKETLGLKGNQKDSQIKSLIPQVEEWIEGYTNQDMPDKDGKYPRGYEKIAIKMIAYDLNNLPKQGIQSETLSRHSVTYASGASSRDYPTDVTKGLRRRLRW